MVFLTVLIPLLHFVRNFLCIAACLLILCYNSRVKNTLFPFRHCVKLAFLLELSKMFSSLSHSLSLCLSRSLSICLSRSLSSRLSPHFVFPFQSIDWISGGKLRFFSEMKKKLWKRIYLLLKSFPITNTNDKPATVQSQNISRLLAFPGFTAQARD